MNAQNVLFATVPKSVEQLSKQLHSKIVDPLVLQNLIDRKLLQRITIEHNGMVAHYVDFSHMASSSNLGVFWSIGKLFLRNPIRFKLGLYALYAVRGNKPLWANSMQWGDHPLYEYVST